MFHGIYQIVSRVNVYTIASKNFHEMHLAAWQKGMTSYYCPVVT